MKTNWKISLAAVPALVVTGTALFLLLAAVSNAAESKPGDLLYALRSPALQLQLAITSDSARRADIEKQLAPVSDPAPKLEDAVRQPASSGGAILNAKKDETRDNLTGANVTSKVDDHAGAKDNSAPLVINEDKSKDRREHTEKPKDDDKNKTTVTIITDDKKGTSVTDDKDEHPDDQSGNEQDNGDGSKDDKSGDDKSGDDKGGDDKSGSSGASSSGEEEDESEDEMDDD